MNRLRQSFTLFERVLWLCSAGLIVLSALLFRGGSAFSVITSLIGVTSLIFAAAYLTARRSAWFALAYAMNDLVLIALWLLASLTDTSYITVLVCFAVFFLNDLYGFLSWMEMRKRQKTV